MQEPPSLKSCLICKKPKVDRLSNLLMGKSGESCQCESNNSSELTFTEEPLTVLFCRECSKRVQDARSGSFTQWIFRHDLCSCENPKVVSVDKDSIPSVEKQSTSRTRQSKSERANEPEIAVEDKGFPIDAFKPIERIASGGMGHIYKCRSRLLGHIVAVKTLRSLTSDHLLQIQQEAKAISRLEHDTILKVFDLGLVDNHPFMVIEYVNGKTLSNIITQTGPLDVHTAVDVFIQVADGLNHAHQRGIFHRDLSNANIMIEIGGRDGIPRVKIIDFGLSMSRAAERQVVTRQGMTIVGTAAYMSPDQIAGKPYDARSEIYSFGCVMFEALTGLPPFQGETPMDVLAQHAEAQPPKISDITSDQKFPVELVEIVDKCLKKNNADRFQSMEEVRDSLKLVLAKLDGFSRRATEANRALQPPEQFKRSNHNIVIGFSGGALVVVLGLLYTLALKQSTSDIFSNSIPALEFLSKVGNGSASVRLAQVFLTGKGVKKDFPKAIELLRSEANKGSPTALCELGRCYQTGLGVTQDVILAREYLQKAVDLQNHRAETYLAFSYRQDLPADYAESEKCMDRALKNGDSLAACVAAIRMCPIEMQDLGDDDSIYGGTSTKSYGPRGKVTKLLKQAAEDNIVDAQFSLGLCLERGFDCEKSLPDAKFWYLKAAKQGDADAEYRYAHILEMEKQHSKSMIQWYKRSAKQGNRDAQLALARCTANGIGTARDTLASDLYMSKALVLDKHVNNTDFSSTSYIPSFMKKFPTRLVAPTFHPESYTAILAHQKSYFWRSMGLVGDDDLIQLTMIPKIKSLDIGFGDVKGDGFLLLRDSDIRSLLLSSSSSVSLEGFRNISKMKHLENLSILGEITPDELACFKGSNLKSISLTSADDDIMKSICEIKTLQKFYCLSHHYENSGEYLDKFADFPDLEELSISLPTLNDDAIAKFRRLRKLETLRLNLYSNKLNDSDLLWIKKISGPSEIHVESHSKYITEKGVQMMAACPSVRKIEVFDAPISTKFQENFDKLYRYKRLTVHTNRNARSTQMSNEERDDLRVLFHDRL